MRLLLLHGALGSESQFDELKKHLSCDVYSLNFEGHGGRPGGEFSMESFVSNVVDFFDENEMGEINIFGYSMGGYVALKLASEFPDRVNKIITLGTKFEWTPEFSANEVRKLNPEKILEKVPGFAASLEKIHAPLYWRDVVLKTAQMMSQLPESGLSEHDLQSISHKVLIMRGEDDNMVGTEESAKVADILPNGSFHSIPGFKHPVEQVDHEKLANLIIGFFDKN